jgi:hypothetical protein
VYDLETRETHEHATVTFAPGIRRRNGLTVSPDGGFILYYGHERAGSDLILVENYR